MIRPEKRRSANLHNRLLAALPQGEREALLPRLKEVELKIGDVIYEPFDSIRYVYFPDDALFSLMSLTEGGGSVEIVLIGSEGVVGVAGLLGTDTTPYRVVIEAAGRARRIEIAALKTLFDQSPALRRLVLRYLHALLVQIAQSSVCNHFHSVEQRLAYWMLASQDRTKADKFPYTQEFLSDILGTDRVSVTRAALALKRAGVIDYARGVITILDRAGLEKFSCECYRIVKAEFEQFLNSLSVGQSGPDACAQ